MSIVFVKGPGHFLLGPFLFVIRSFLFNKKHFFRKRKRSQWEFFSRSERKNYEYIKLDRDKSTFKSHRDFSSEKEISFKHF